MATWPLGRFVDRPAPDALVRYECNDAAATAPRRMGPDFTLGAPTLDGDPDAVGVTWGFRQPSFTQRVKGPKRAALEALAGLSRELLRRTNWFEFKLDQQTPSVWLRVYRSTYSPLSLARVYVDTETGDETPFDEDEAPNPERYRLIPDAWEIEIPLTADPFLYGERVTIDPVTVTQAPTGDHPMRWELPPIKGDAVTPLRLTVAPTSSSGRLDAAWLVGSISRDTDVDDTIVDLGPGDGFTSIDGTDTTSSDPNYFGSGYRTISIGANEQLTSRLTGILPPLDGQYKVVLRAEFASDTIANVLFRLTGRAMVASTPVFGPTATATARGGVFRGWVDLGQFTLPIGAARNPDLDDTPASTLASLVSIDATTADGSPASIRVDALRFIPIDNSSQTLTLTYPEAPPGASTGPAVTRTVVIDGQSESFVSIDAATGTRALGAPSPVGGFPTADPAAAHNVLFLMCLSHGRPVGASSSTPTVASLNAPAVLGASYHPMHLHIPGNA